MEQRVRNSKKSGTHEELRVRSGYIKFGFSMAYAIQALTYAQYDIVHLLENSVSQHPYDTWLPIAP